MDIIEKLGITQGPWHAEKEDPDYGERNFVAWENTECDETIICEAKYGMKDAALIATAPEMLEALINATIHLEHIPGTLSPDNIFLPMVEIIEKATGKSWEEIKELL